MTPDSKKTDHPFAVWWRRWAGLIALVALVAGGAAGFVKLEHASDRATHAALVAAHTAKSAKREGEIREEQFCGLILSGFAEKQKQLRETKIFLAGPAGQEETALIVFIRANLPKTIHEVARLRKNIPDVCWQYQTQEGAH